MSNSADARGDLLKRTQAYVAASNDHDLAAIEPMLAATCVYRSSGVGAHEGVSAIITMMRDFFTAYPDVHWQTRDYRPRGPAGVEFDFVITMEGKETPGVERLFFDDAGRITRIEVER